MELAAVSEEVSPSLQIPTAADVAPVTIMSTVPSVEDGVDANSSAVSNDSVEVSTVLLEASVQTASSACHRGYVKKARDMAPRCIDQCSSSCYAVGEAIDAYLRRGGQPAAMKSVCRNKRAFSCFVTPSHVGNCRVFFDKARKFGISLPSSERDLDRRCGRRLAARNP